MFDFLTLPLNIKKDWIEALESGEYKQGYNTLYRHQDNAYCCLGVLCDVLVKHGMEDYENIKITKDQDSLKVLNKDNQRTFTASIIGTTSNSKDIQNHLTMMNDDDLNSFNEIAQYLRTILNVPFSG